MAKSTPNKQLSEIDRLIELASDERSLPAVVEGTRQEADHGHSHALSIEDKKDPNPSMWRAMLQLRALLPYLTRALPLLERGLLGTNVLGTAQAGASRAESNHLAGGLAELQAAQREFAQQLKDQNGDIKYLHEQMTWLNKSLELETHRQEEIVEAMTSLKKVIRTWAIAVVVWLVVLIGVEVFSMLRLRG